MGMPDWLPEAREFCQRAGIEVYGWGPDTLTVKADSPEPAEQVASGLRPLGFEPVKDEDDAHASTLLLSRNPAATRAKQNGSRASFDLSKQPLIQRIVPIFEAALSLTFFWFSTTRPAPKSWLMAAVGSIFLAIFLWEGGRVWGWGLQMSPEELRVRRYFRWSAIPWAQIRAVEAKTKYARGAAFVTVTLVLASKSRLRVGTFGDSFASALRDRLREEIAQRQRKQN
jgi:hypothetical protein